MSDIARAILGLPPSAYRPRYPRGHRPVNNGLAVCIECGEDLELIKYVGEQWRGPHGPYGYFRHRHRNPPAPSPKPIPDNDRTHCSVCGRRFQAYELEPGSGRCRECQT